MRQPSILQQIDKSWTLFLDRDGVLNYEKEQDYILKWEEYRFFENVPEAMAILAKKFGLVIIVTNQKGVGKKLMSEQDLEHIHENLKQIVKKAGGRIDQVYYCTELDDAHPNRKPNTGMAMQARQAYPKIDFNKSVMVGNRLTDMRFGRSAGMYTVYLTTTHPDIEIPHADIDMVFPSLVDFASSL